MNPIAKYFQDLSERFGAAWNRFWFTPADPYVLSVLRILTGLCGIWYLGSYATDLVTWFGANGLLPIDAVRQLTIETDGLWNGRVSHLYFINEPGALRLVHGLAMLILAAFTIGLATRITNILSLAVVLAYVHRAPMITGQLEPVLTLLLFYLCFAPAGRYLSVDAWLRRRSPGAASSAAASDANLSSGIVLRLVQVHIAMLYATMAFNKLGASDTWWAGQAMWWLIAQTESRLIDLTFLYNSQYLVNIWTHAVVAFELAYGLLIWNRLARPALLIWSIPHWILLGLVTGLLSFSAIMLVVNVAFVSPELLRAIFARQPEPTRQAKPELAKSKSA